MMFQFGSTRRKIQFKGDLLFFIGTPMVMSTMRFQDTQPSDHTRFEPLEIVRKISVTGVISIALYLL